jgi:hypothetical protein
VCVWSVGRLADTLGLKTEGYCAITGSCNVKGFVLIVYALPRSILLGRRGNPAAYPDRDPETTLFPDGWVANNETKFRRPATPKTTPVYFQLQEPKLEDKTLFQNYAVCIH